MIDSNVIRVIILREVKKFVREKSRLISSIARPVIWLFLVGGGLSRLVPDQGGVSYIQFIYPGIIGMTVLFSSIFSAISIIWDKEFGYMKEILVAPVSRSSIVLGKALSGTIVSMIQVFMILLLSPFLGISLDLFQVAEVLLIAFMLSFCLCNIGILIAVFYDSFESFSVIMNFIVMPMFFLSGAMYPVNKLPAVLSWLARVNPLTYGIDGLKNVIFPLSGGSVSDFPVGTDLVIIVLTSAIFITLSTLLFRTRLK
ncbi:MAG: ABC transporter permease [Nitrospirota bacterium]|nr:MAG: ABC transporter permease [Nitrospirota bacterium]